MGNKTKAPLGAHLRQVAKTKKIDPDHLVAEHVGEAAVTPLTSVAAWYWGVFIELGSRRSYGAHAPDPIKHADVEAWQWINQVDLDHWEVTLIFAIDDCFLEVCHGRLRRTGTADQEPGSRSGDEGTPRPGRSRKAR